MLRSTPMPHVRRLPGGVDLRVHASSGGRSVSPKRPSPDYAPASLQWDQAMSAIAHRMRSPVSAIQIHAGILKKHVLAGDEEYANSVAGIEAGADELNRVIHTFSMARAVGLDQFDVYEERTDVGEFARDCAAEASRRLEGRRIEVIVPHEVIAPIDRILVSDILVELLDNAARFSPPDSPIEVAVERAGDHDVEIAVTDRGTGIPRESREDVFEAFVKLDPNRSGLGLGLYIARGAARALGGELQMNEPAHGGSRFTLTLPPA
jgi:two-component system, OmpR family, sensor histidine kinase KdpD